MRAMHLVLETAVASLPGVSFLLIGVMYLLV